MGDLVESALEPFRAREKQRVHISGPSLPVAPHCAVMISMMLHELATNAAKYGALSDDNGEVLIEWHPLDGDAGVRLEWREKDGPPVVPPERKGFGTTLIQRGLTAQLGGTANIEFAPDGLRCTLECPVR
jgi:two-component sensor histidine kinase